MGNDTESTKSGNNSLVKEKFLFDCDHLLTFCSGFSNVNVQDQTDSILEAKLDGLEKRWSKLDVFYGNLMLSPSSEDNAEFKQNAKAQFNACSESFFVCKSHIVDLLRISRGSTTSHNTSFRMSLPGQSTPLQNFGNSIKLPSCDTEIFEGGYEKWPSFRDMFTAVYINGTNCQVVNLFHLRNKTSRDAGAIVKHYPLYDDSLSLLGMHSKLDMKISWT